MRLCIIKHGQVKLSETFIRLQVAHLPMTTFLVEGRTPSDVLSPFGGQSAFSRLGGRLAKRFYPTEEQLTRAYREVLRRTRADAVLAQYAPTAVRVLDACLAERLPLVVHFHGYDASRREVLEKYRDRYTRLLEHAAGIVVVSRQMEQRVIEMGANPKKIYYSPCGVDCTLFEASSPDLAPPTFVSVGRFVEKKAPHLTLLAFARVFEEHPQARLRMIGDGHLLDVCRDLARALGIADAVAFLGAQPHEVVREEMSNARAFVQHSVEAFDGDTEGTPVAVLEASASGLPVVATRHAGIADVVVEEETGLLADEHDFCAMATHMRQMVEDPNKAACLGRSGRQHVLMQYSLQRSMERLGSALEASLR